MASLQYIIDTICANFTEKAMYELMRARLNQGPFTIAEILPVIQNKDRSLDSGSAKMLAEAAFEILVQQGDVRMEGDCVYPAG